MTYEEFEVQKLLDEYPLLSIFGMGIYNRNYNPADNLKALSAGRDELLATAPRIAQVARWLEAHITPTNTINTRYSSYTLKHVAEKAMGDYITNGQFIAAALLVGYKHRHAGGPNIYFAMSHKSVQAASARGDAQPQPR